MSNKPTMKPKKLENDSDLFQPLKWFGAQRISFLLIVALVIYWLIIVSQGRLLLSPDSTFYLAYAQDIFHYFDFSNIKTFWPPMYPVLIAVGHLFTESELGAAMIVAGASLALVLLMLFKIMRLVGFPLFITLSLLIMLFFNSAFIYIFRGFNS